MKRLELLQVTRGWKTFVVIFIMSEKTTIPKDNLRDDFQSEDHNATSCWTWPYNMIIT